MVIMGKIQNYVKSLSEGKRTLCKATIMALLPILCCIVYCALQGHSVMDVYLPAGEWNDELLYFKQIEAVVEHGIPLGYFGYNEGHAEYLSFGAWSPVLFIPWVLWGLLFGWNLMSPILCNIFLMTVAMFVFVVLTKLNWKQLGALALLYCLFPMFTRYVLSGMPEIICISMVIVFYGLGYSYLKCERGAKIVWMFVLSALLTLMRPYMCLFMFLPIFLWVRRSKSWQSIAGSVTVLLGTFGMYVVINNLLGAEYLEPMFSVEWLKVLLDEGIAEGIRYILFTLVHKGAEFAAGITEALRSGYPVGAFFTVFLVSALIMTVQCVIGIVRRKFEDTEADMILCGHCAFTFWGMFAAQLLMYSLNDGSRHLNTFVAAAICLIAVTERKLPGKTAVLGILFLYLFAVKGNYPHFYQVPFATEERLEWVQYWEDAFAEEMALERVAAPNYDNVVSWVLIDSIEGGTPTLTDWNALYALPAGMGINCCYSDYINDNIKRLKGKYLATLSGGSVDVNCINEGFKEIGRNGNVVIYRVR